MSLYSTFLAANWGLFIFISIAHGKQETTPNICNFNAKLTQNLYNQGFHRNITYTISFNHNRGKETWLYRNCVLALDQILPAGVFANPDELDELSRQSKLILMSFVPVNTELAAEHSYPTSVLISGKVMEDQVAMWLPLHARYHRSRPGGGTFRNYIEPPRIFLSCPNEKLKKCNYPERTFTPTPQVWMEIPFTVTSDPVFFQIPIGNMHHYVMVCVITAAVVLVGTFRLCAANFKYTDKQRYKQIK